MKSTTKQSLRLLEASQSDALEILEMHIASFTSPYEPVFFLLFPNEENREKGVKRMVDWWLDDPTARYLKVVDTETGKIVSAAKWCIHKESPGESDLSLNIYVDWLPDAGMNSWGEEIIFFLHQEQMSRCQDGGCCVIDMLSTHPDYQYLGAGSMLVKWGTDLADSLGLKAFVQGSRVGKHLYEKHGFVDREGWITVPVTDKHSNRPLVGWFNLDRPARKEAGPTTKGV